MSPLPQSEQRRVEGIAHSGYTAWSGGRWTAEATRIHSLLFLRFSSLLSPETLVGTAEAAGFSSVRNHRLVRRPAAAQGMHSVGSRPSCFLGE